MIFRVAGSVGGGAGERTTGGGCGNRYDTCDSAGGGLGFSPAVVTGAASPPKRSRSVTLASGAIATSEGCRKISDSLPTFVASKILNACSGLASTVTALATVGRS